MHKENLIRRIGITFADFAVFLILMAIFTVIFFTQYAARNQISYFSVRTDEKTVILSPSENRDLNLESSGYRYLIRVRKGSILVYRADCPDKLCVRTGAINASGERIICIPGRLVITAVGRDEFDAVNR